MPAIGGANRSIFWTASEVDGTMGSVPVYTSTKKISTNISRLEFSLDQNEHNPTLTTFIETYAPDSGGATDDSGEYEDGTKFSSLTANSPTLVHLSIGGVDSDTGKRYYMIQVIKMSQESGGFTQQSGQFAKPVISGDVQKVQTALTFPSNLFPTPFYSNATDVTIAVGKGVAQGWFDNA